MKLVKAIIRPSRLEEVKAALSEKNVEGMTVTEVRGFGRQKGKREIYRGSEYTVDLLPKVMLDVALPDDKVAEIVEAIQATAVTDKIGDGKIFVLSLEDTIRIRTGEHGEKAI